ncbi:Na(+)/H(+) antiporter subunit C [Streptomyces sp. NBRC 109706]|uniref:Na(+)/H(+) antiporter subunit C n=1 Tax=Streptomyces sp. NBRC 109706 TaxID=1550035 RepID=UPI00078116FA|nr:Na(+)/H(+) antiporter subunit C [Streptomyces sp. NBRC 109706]
MTTLDLVMALVVGGLFAAGFYLLLDRSLMRVLLGVIVLGHAANLLLLLTGGPPGVPPVLGDADAGERYADPLPQAMALTAIVITFGITTLLLALVHRAWQLDGHDEVRDDVEDRRIGTIQDRAESGPPLPTDRDQEPGGRQER